MTNSGWIQRNKYNSTTKKNRVFPIVSLQTARIQVSTCCFTKKKNEQKERKKSKQQQQSTNKQVGPPVNGCRGIISNHHRNITSDLCTSKPRRKNITQLVDDVTLNRKESGNDSRRSKRPGEKKYHVSLSWVLAHFFGPCSCVRAHNISFFALRHSLLFHYQSYSFSSREWATREMINHFFSSLNCY